MLQAADLDFCPLLFLPVRCWVVLFALFRTGEDLRTVPVPVPQSEHPHTVKQNMHPCIDLPRSVHYLMAQRHKGTNSITHHHSIIFIRRNKKLLGAPGIATRNKDDTSSKIYSTYVGCTNTSQARPRRPRYHVADPTGSSAIVEWTPNS